MSLDVVAILGPTASGKSAFALRLVDALGNFGIQAEIVNADAMQLYRLLDIGTAKATPAERATVTHHLIDILDPAEEYTASQYRDAFDAVVARLRSESKLPLLVGGSMFYISSALDELDFSATDSTLRAELESRVASEGIGFVVRELERLDPASLAHIPKGNLRRLIRALEVNMLTGEGYRHSLPTPEFRRPTLQLGIHVDRAALVKRIDARVIDMWQRGLLHEVEGLMRSNIQLGRTAAVAIGYKQALAQLAGELTEAEAIASTQQLTRRYARRQMSWFRRDTRTSWSENPDPTEIAERIRLLL